MKRFSEWMKMREANAFDNPEEYRSKSDPFAHLDDPENKMMHSRQGLKTPNSGLSRNNWLDERKMAWELGITVPELVGLRRKGIIDYEYQPASTTGHQGYGGAERFLYNPDKAMQQYRDYLKSKRRSSSGDDWDRPSSTEDPFAEYD